MCTYARYSVLQVSSSLYLNAVTHDTGILAVWIASSRPYSCLHPYIHTLLAYTSLTILEIGLPFGSSDGVDLSSTGASNGDALVKGITQR